MDACVLFKFTLCPIDAGCFPNRVRCQVLEHPMGDPIATIVRHHKIRIRANIVETGKAVLHDLRDACRRGDHRVARLMDSGGRQKFCRRDSDGDGKTGFDLC